MSVPTTVIGFQFYLDLFFWGGGGGAGGILSAPILNLNNIFIIFKNAIKPLGFCRNLSPYSFM